MRHKSYILFALVSLFLIGQFNFANAIPEENLGDRIDSYIKTAVEAGFSGAVLAATKGEVILHKGYGLADRENNIPVKAETVFDIGSITKRFTRAAVLKLEEQGKLKRSDTLSKFFKDIPEDKAGITVEQVLEHTAGFHEYHDTSGDFEEMDRDKAQKIILNQKLRFKPGERQAYSNSGYGLLAIIIEVVSGQSYPSFLKENLFKPAGMERTGFYRDPLWKAEEVAIGYESRKIGEINSPLFWPHMTWALIGGGGMVAPVGDLYKWIQALDANKVLSEEAKAKMYGRERGPMAYAGGNDFGFNSVVFEYPQEERYIIVATNTWANMSAETVGRAISQILKGEEPEKIDPDEVKKKSAAASEWGLPSSVTGIRASAFLDAVNRMDLDYVKAFIKENLTQEFIDKFSMGEHLAVFKQLHKEIGEIDLLGANKTGEHTAELLIASKKTGQRVRVFFELEPDEPHRIASLSIKEEKE